MQIWIRFFVNQLRSLVRGNVVQAEMQSMEAQRRDELQDEIYRWILIEHGPY